MSIGQILDSRIVHPNLSARRVDVGVARGLFIPSSRYYYLAADGISAVPYIAGYHDDDDPEQLLRDIEAWQTTPPHDAIYVLERAASSRDPATDLVRILQGVQVLLPPDPVYLAEVAEILRGLMHISITPTLVRLLFSHPINPAANYVAASLLASRGGINGIQQYLDECGIIHFTARDIAPYTAEDKFFFLTRFYSPPLTGDLEAKYYTLEYTRKATDPLKTILAMSIAPNYDKFRKYRDLFDRVYADQSILGKIDMDRFIADPYPYIKLLGRSPNLPPLSFALLRKLDIRQVQPLAKLLKSYTDDEILDFVGRYRKIVKADTRQDLVRLAAERLLKDTYTILLPDEASLCTSRETLFGNDLVDLGYFLGKGNYTTGFVCYEVDEFIQAFESTRESGRYTFYDPHNLKQELSTKEIKRILRALESNRRGVRVDPSLIEHFNKYTEISEAQGRTDYVRIRKIREWVSQSPMNRDLLLSALKAYLHAGLYMRQWRGPGHAYPVFSHQTGREPETEDAQRVIDVRAANEAKVVLEYLDKMPQHIQDAFWSLRVYFHENGKPTDKGKDIKTRWLEVFVGGMCIRTASGPWVYTALYYLKYILDETIPGLPLADKLDFIY